MLEDGFIELKLIIDQVVPNSTAEKKKMKSSIWNVPSFICRNEEIKLYSAFFSKHLSVEL